MATRVVMEALSPTMEEGRVARWLKKEGDAVRSGDVLAEVETDKAIMELQARGDGTLRKIVVPEGGTTAVGNVVAVIAGRDEDVSALLEGQKGQQGQERQERQQSAPAKSPAPAASASSAASAPPASAAPAAEAGRVKASPLARRLASEKGVDLRVVRGSGPGGRIIRRDIAAAPAPSAAPAPPVAGEGWEDIPLTQIRKTIARRLAQSIGPIPHFFLTAEIDMERGAEARDALNGLGEGKVSFNDVIIKTVAMALRQHPECNAWWQDDHIRVFHDVHLGMAVAVEEGLITPVIRHAHRKSLREISAEAADLAARARARKLTPEEYTGATFSISNLGMLGIDEFTAVINPPEAAILAVGALAEKPVAVNGTLVVRRRMRVTMSCDHRVIDGATGARFLQTVKRMLENPLAIVW
jgi:pyruvate dehydrogenase E2 component (dihydrolipoamide acetyltransferase)